MNNKDEIKKKMYDSFRRCLKPEDSYLTRTQFAEIYKEIMPRKPFYRCDDPNDMEKEAGKQLATTCIPTMPLTELKQRAEKQDAKAILLYADCLRFGLKGAERSNEKAIKLYQQAAEMKLPEAAVAIAVLYFVKLAKAYNQYDSMMLRFWDIPREVALSSEKTKLEKMWFWLDRSVEGNWHSMFVHEQFDSVRKTGSWLLSQTMTEYMTKFWERAM
jgi:TPR repeat protein